MEKKALFLFLICSISFLVEAQNFEGGIIVGASTSQVSGDELAGFNKIGIMVGAFTNRKIKDFLQMQLELIYIQNGYTI